jgi:HSP20 family protein
VGVKRKVRVRERQEGVPLGNPSAALGDTPKGAPMFNVEEQTTRLEQLYRQITGSEPKRNADQPVAPIPPDANPEQYVQENLQKLQIALQGLGISAGFTQPGLPVVSPRVALLEDQDNYRIVVELPGVKREDLTVQLAQGILLLSATRGLPGADGRSERPLYTEVIPCRFERSLPVPPFVKFDSGEGKLENGILSLRLQKDPSAVRRDFKIEVA